MVTLPDIVLECLGFPAFEKYFASIYEDYCRISIGIKENSTRNRCRKVDQGVYEIEVMDRTPYYLAHELEHCFIFERGFPEVQVDRECLARLSSLSRIDILDKLSKIAENLNSLIYDPLIDQKLESCGFEIDCMHGVISDKRPPFDFLKDQDSLSRKMSILYFSLKRYLLEKYCHLTECPFIGVYINYSDIDEKSREIIMYLKQCQYRDPSEVEGLFIKIISILGLRYNIQGKVISISLFDIRGFINR